MRHLRLVAAAAAMILTVAGHGLVGAVRQNSASISQAGPFDALHFREIGPASMSGRISDIAAYEPNPGIFYVGTAHGGVWKTINAGTTFTPQLQDMGLMSIGDIAVSQSNPDLVWVGTGESNNRQSTSWGDGVYKSADGGKTYTNMGLRASRAINRVVIDPRDTDVVFVAATGSLFGPGGDRGVFKTGDGGSTWKQVLKVDDDTGANDLVMDATNNQVLYASTYQRRRTACCMNGGGPGSGIWKSIDGGEKWTRLEAGLPKGPLGRIGLDVSRKRPDIVYALVEGPVPQAGRGVAGEESPGGQRGQGAQAGGRGVAQGVNETPTGLYRSDDAGATWRKVNNVNPRPMYFSQVRVDPNDPEVIYLGGVGLHQSLDGGKTVATDVAASTHDDVHAIWIDPRDSNHVIIGNDGGLAVSHDMAKTWAFVPNLPVGLFYHVSYDMAMPFNVCGGMQDNYNWCGPSAVRGSAGIANHHWTTLQGGDGFVVLQDPGDYRVAYSESQDGNMVRVDRVTGETISIRPQAGPGEAALRWNWDTPLVHSPHDPKVLYAAANRVFRSADRGLSWVAVSGDLTSGANRDEIATMGVKAADIQIAKNDGIVAWPTIVSFAESPRRAGLLYAGTDDGCLQVSRDAGKTWTNVFSKLPGAPRGTYVSEVVPSRFDEATVYAALDAHRQNDFEGYVYASTDYGQSWRTIGANLRTEVARTLTEDLKNPDVLYLGTETGLFVTLDRGRSWTRVKANLPTVRIDEIAIHPRDNAMILATHGRALWILDHLEPIQEYATVKSTTADAKLFTPPPSAMYRRPARDRNYEFWGDQTFFGENPPQAALITWFNRSETGEVTLRITDAGGREVREVAGTVLANSNKPGIQSACWDLRVQPIPAPEAGGRGGRAVEAEGRGEAGASPSQPPPGSAVGAGCAPPAGGFAGFGGFGTSTAGPFVLPGVYTVTLIVGGKAVDARPLRVVADPQVVLTEAERKKMFDMAMELHELQRRGTGAATSIASINRQLPELAKTIAGRSDIPADVKTSFEAFHKDTAGMASRLATGGGRGRGGAGQDAQGAGRGGAEVNLLARLGQAKNGLMAGMPATEQTLKGYEDARTQVPNAIVEADALVTRASALASTLAKFNVTLTVPTRSRTE